MPDYPIFLLVDGGSGKCGYKRRAQMAKDYFGAKGLIIIDDKKKLYSNNKYFFYSWKKFWHKARP